MEMEDLVETFKKCLDRFYDFGKWFEELEHCGIPWEDTDTIETLYEEWRIWQESLAGDNLPNPEHDNSSIN